jgi:flavodoxin
MDTPAHILVVVSVHHANTLRVAAAMSSATGMPILPPGEEASRLIREGATPALGSGIFFGHHHEQLLRFAGGLPVFNDRIAYVFSTSGTGLRPMKLIGWHYHSRLVNLLASRGFTVSGQFGCRGFDTYGPWGRLGGIARGRPSEQELREAQLFARSMADATTQGR